MDYPKVYADFQNLDDSNRVRLTCAGTKRDIERLRLDLRNGLVLTLYTDDANDDGCPDELRVEGIVQFSEVAEEWVAQVDWSALRHASDEVSLSAPPHIS